jgi:hypothetical protein
MREEGICGAPCSFKLFCRLTTSAGSTNTSDEPESCSWWRSSPGVLRVRQAGIGSLTMRSWQGTL